MTNKRAWTGIFPYLAGLDTPIPTDGMSDRFVFHARNLEKRLDAQQITCADKQRRRNIKS